MKHISIVIGAVILAAVVMLLTGCGHNVVNYSDGIGFETTFRPDSGNFGFVFRYGKILSACVRENSEVEMTGDGKASGSESAGSAAASGSLKIKIGKQITGYYVDALKAGAKPESL